MRHGSLFSGIGGFDLAAEWMGWENVFHCEWNPFGQKVLKHYWPNAISYNDITKTDFTIHRGTIDILTGGFPCQPYSSAGKRLGKDDERHLWPEMLRCIREVSPRWIVGENVRGLTNWNGGMVFDEVQADLEAIGYEVLPFLLPACAVNAPHRRDRIWFIANAKSARAGENIGRVWSESYRCGKGIQETRVTTNTTSDGHDDKSATQNNGIRQDNQQSRTQRECTFEGFSNEWDAANTESESSRRELQQQQKQRKSGGCNSRTHSNNWENFPTVSPVCNGDDGLSNRLDGITFSKWRNESIKAGGNAVVPQVVYQIFKAIEQYGIQNSSQHKSTF